MNDRLTQTLAHLESLVGFDTQNPPRKIDSTGIYAYLVSQLGGFELTLEDLGDGCVSLLATRGQPTTLFNFHIDTVPVSPEWSDDPFLLRVGADRAVGLGACDIKGASACMLTAAAHTQGDLALLFSSDEEGGSSRCINDFLSRNHGFERVIVAEPTGAKAVLAHRGIATALMQFTGIAGHASDPRALADSAVHRAARWATRALDFAEEHNEDRYEDLSGIRFNIGRIEGGIKPNIIAPDALVRFGVRTLPGQDGETLLTALRNLAEPHEVASFEPVFIAPSLPARTEDLAGTRAWARALDLTPGEPVDFWTEAALFSAANMAALVFGPGHIAQAHSADEWVELQQLSDVTEIYSRLIQ